MFLTRGDDGSRVPTADVTQPSSQVQVPEDKGSA